MRNSARLIVVRERVNQSRGKFANRVSLIPIEIAGCGLIEEGRELHPLGKLAKFRQGFRMRCTDILPDSGAGVSRRYRRLTLKGR